MLVIPGTFVDWSPCCLISFPFCIPHPSPFFCCRGVCSGSSEIWPGYTHGSWHLVPVSRFIWATGVSWNYPFLCCGKKMKQYGWTKYRPRYKIPQVSYFFIIADAKLTFVIACFPRRMTMADIERIAPLEEGTLPYNLVEAQRQVTQDEKGWYRYYFLV